MPSQLQKIQLVRDAIHRGMAHQEVDRIVRVDKLQDGLRVILDDDTVLIVSIVVHRGSRGSREEAFVEGFDDGRPTTDVLGDMRERAGAVERTDEAE